MGVMANHHARRLLALVLLSVPLLVLSTHAAPAQILPGEMPAELAVLQSDQVEVEFLAEAMTEWESGGNVALHLSRIVDPGDRSEQIVSGVGPELWYVESGAAIIEQFGGTTTRVEAGESIVVDGTAGAAVRFDDRPCPSVLRLEVASSAEPRQPQAPIARAGRMGVICQPSGTLLLTDGLPAPSMPVRMFISWLEIAGQAAAPAASFSGPVGFSVEEGAIGFGDRPGNVVLGPGSWASFAAGEPVALSNIAAEPSSGWLVGLIAESDSDAAPPPTEEPTSGAPPAEEPEPTEAAPPPEEPAPTEEPAAPVSPTPVAANGVTYTSPTYGWSVTYDPSTWYLLEEQSLGGFDSLVLWNEISDLVFSSGPAPMNALECLDYSADLQAGEEFASNVQPVLGDDGQPMRGGDESRAWSLITYDYSDPSATPLNGQYTLYAECVSIIPGEVILLISHSARSELYEIDAPLAQEVIATLTLP